MNIKKLIAGAAASVFAVSTMAVAASAAGPITASVKNAADDGNGNFQVFLAVEGENVYGLEYSKIASIDVTLSFDCPEDGWVGGALITQCDANSWNQIGDYATDTENRKWGGVKSGDTLTLDIGEGAFADDSTYVIVTVQNYSDGINVNIDNVVLKDASGAVILDLAGGASAPAETEAPAATEATASTGNTNTAAPDKNNADTGVEGVAVVAGIAIVAAGAIVVAKKRK